MKLLGGEDGGLGCVSLSEVGREDDERKEKQKHEKYVGKALCKCIRMWIIV